MLGRPEHGIKYRAEYVDDGSYDEYCPPRADRVLNQTSILAYHNDKRKREFRRDNRP